MAETLREFCVGLLSSGSLEARLVRPVDAGGRPLPDVERGVALAIDRPVRDARLRMAGGRGKLPRPGELGDPAARARCLGRFAHHELMAVELLAWALLRWPEAPDGLRALWCATLVDEQRHLELYRSRLLAAGSDLGDEPLSDYFWKQVPAIDAHPGGARAFLAGLGLTLEQANLDFAGLYADAFRRAGDEPSADVCEQVHDDEIRHVRGAASWLARLSPGLSQVEAYERNVPFPLAASRAKGRAFRADSRRAAGLDEAFIEHVRTARSSAQTARARAGSDARDRSGGR